MFAFTQPTWLLQIKTIISLLIMQIQYAQEWEKNFSQSSHYRLFIITTGDGKKLICFDPISSINFVVLVVGKILTCKPNTTYKAWSLPAFHRSKHVNLALWGSMDVLHYLCMQITGHIRRAYSMIRIYLCIYVWLFICMHLCSFNLRWMSSQCQLKLFDFSSLVFLLFWVTT